MAKKSLFVPTLIIGKILLIFLILYFNLGMFGFDSYIHLQYIDAIIENKHIFEFSISPSYYDFAGFHILASGISLMTGISSEILYEFISIIIPILIFDLTIVAFIRHTEKKKKGYIPNNMKSQYLALILLFPALIGIQMFLGRPNSLGISLFSLCLFLYLCKTESFRAQIVASILAVVTVQIHHLSALFLVPIIIFVSLFLIKDFKSIVSLTYAIPVVLIIDTILKSREFEKVNYFLSLNPAYENIFNTFIKNKFIFFFLWMSFIFVSYFSRVHFRDYITRKYRNLVNKFEQNKHYRGFSKVSTKINLNRIAYLGIIGILILVEIIGLFSYSTSLSSWYISVELVLLFILSGLALISRNTVKISLFILGFFFYGMTVVFSLLFSSEPELSWVAPRTFIFTVIFISLLAYLVISDWLPKLRKYWKIIFLSILVFNSYLSFAYIGSQYLPNYNLTNNYQNLTIAKTMESLIDFNVSTSSIPFSISKFINGINIYTLPIILSSRFTIDENAYHLVHTGFKYIVIGTTMDQWLGLPYHLTQDELTYLLNIYYFNDLSFHVVISNGNSYLLYNLWWI